ncbi:MAG TPA: DUF1634 domain-containing protein, partial [Thermodesulfobacteriota bacterium]|nr:DUF1634 domain-containing protein [Thermodesulfobacteriota bacterium]
EAVPRGDSSQFEQAIGTLLIAGVAVSLLLMSLGILLLYLDLHSMAISQKDSMFLHEKNFFSFVWNLIAGGHVMPMGTRLLTLGIATLILTPYLRVVLSAFYYVAVKDLKYAMFTLFVLGLLSASLYVH